MTKLDAERRDQYLAWLLSHAFASKGLGFKLYLYYNEAYPKYTKQSVYKQVVYITICPYSLRLSI